MAGNSISTERRGELEVTRLAGSAATLEFADYSAHVLTWQPAHTRPVLFLSPHTAWQPGRAIRGGVPLVFPWFGPKADDAAAAQHGFARVRFWRQEVCGIEKDGTARVVLTLHDDESTRAAWPHAFAARLEVRAGRVLDLALTVRNCDAVAWRCEAALHTYFAVSAVRAVNVQNLESTDFVERAGARGSQGSDPVTFPHEIDRIYVDTAATCVIADSGWRRRIVVAKTGSRTTVVWNPGPEKGRAMKDLGEPAWEEFVCVETVCARDDAITLAPGEEHTLGATISVEQE